MITKTVNLKKDCYVKLKSHILEELKGNGKTYTISEYIERLLDERNRP